jgi:hypothetical protein
MVCTSYLGFNLNTSSTLQNDITHRIS